MKRVLVYVDAENIRLEQLTQVMQEISNEQSRVIGKFYGVSTVLGEITAKCLEFGFDYIDTSMMSMGRKNVTDMKIVVDCVYDAFVTFCGNVDDVWLISNDHDFTPLIYKLKGQGIDIHAPFITIYTKRATASELHKYLLTNNFDPKRGLQLFEKPYAVIMEATNNEFVEDVIKEYVDKKKNKIAKYFGQDLGDAVYNKIQSVPVESFSISDVLDATIGAGCTDVLEILDLYTSKMYGVQLSRTEACVKYDEWRRG